MEIDALTLPQRIVLLSVADLAADGETPARTNEIVRTSRELSESVDEVGALTEGEVGRALNELEAEELVSVPAMDDTSPTGKGRPSYELAEDAAAVREALTEDDRVSGAVDS